MNRRINKRALANKLLKVASSLVAPSVLDGMNKQKARRYVNNARTIVSFTFNKLPEEVQKEIKNSQKKAIQVLNQVRSKLNREFPEKKFKKPVLDGTDKIVINADDSAEWKVISGIEISLYPIFEREGGSSSPIIGVNKIDTILYLNFPGNNYEKLKYFDGNIPSSSKVFSLVMAEKNRMQKTESLTLDKKAIRQFMNQQRTWFEEDDESENSISFISREYGDIGSETAGVKDIKESKRLQKLLRNEFVDLKIVIEVVDEWVELIITVKG